MAVLTMAAGCAKEAVSGPNDANKRFMDAWMYVNYPDIQPSGLGIYVLEEQEGEGDEVIKACVCVSLHTHGLFADKR